MVNTGPRPKRTFPRELAARAAVAAIALPLIGLPLWLGGGYAAALLALAGAIGGYEYYRLTPLRAASVRWIGIVATAGACGLPLLAPDRWAPLVLAIAVGAAMASWADLLAYGPRPEAPAYVGHVVAGIAFVAGGLGALAALRARSDGLAWSVGVLATAWANDTGAFVGGKLIGSHKLLPAVSPGKTREGLAIGALAGVAAALAMRVWFDAITWADAVAIGVIAAVFGPIGDLCKSMLKRSAGTKDSGSLFGPHGGMLDRIDAVLFDAVGVLGYVTLLAR